MKNKIIFFLLFMMIIAACRQLNKENVVTEFPKKAQLSATVLKTEPVIFLPDKMLIINDQLWINQRMKNPTFDVFHLPDGEYLYSTGTKGQGPNEFINTSVVQKLNDRIYILDHPFVKINEIGDNGRLKTIDTYKPFIITPINGLIVLNENLFCSFAYCATGLTGKEEYRMSNRINGKEKVFSLYPKLSAAKYEGEQRCQIYIKRLVSNPKTLQFAAFYAYFKFIRFYNYDGVMEKEIFVEIPPYKPENVDDSDERMFYYIGVESTEKYIYALCANSKPNDDETLPEMQVWDWEGNPVIQYTFDKIFISFVVSEDDKKMYATTYDNDDEIYVYDMIHLK